MIKKITLATTLLFTLVHAEIKQTGFFIGADVGSKSSNVKYDSDGAYKYDMVSNNDSLSFKLGYQYYFTRVYARINSFIYQDTKRDNYTLKGRTYELNADYIPVFYMSKSKKWNLRGVFGFAAGYSSSKLENYDVNLLPVGITAERSQRSMEYGTQIGLMSETSIGLSVEIGLRLRQGPLIELTDGVASATFNRDDKEYYLGVNYLF